MKSIILILGILFLGYACSAKKQSLKSNKSLNYIPYYLKVYEADSLRWLDKHNESYTILNNLFKDYTPVNYPPYYEFEEYVKDVYINKKLKNRDLIKRLITNFGFVKSYTEHDSIYKLMYSDASLTIKEYNKLRKKYILKIDLKLRDAIISKVALDQYYRNKYSKGEKWKEIDSKNNDFLVKLFEQNIYPNENIIGNHTIDNKHPWINILLLHTSDSMRINYFLPKIKNFLIEGKCAPIIYGNMIDQLKIYNKEKQVYGTFNINEINKIDYNQFNIMRKTIGLPSIEFELWRIKTIREKYNL